MRSTLLAVLLTVVLALCLRRVFLVWPPLLPESEIMLCSVGYLCIVLLNIWCMHYGAACGCRPAPGRVEQAMRVLGYLGLLAGVVAAHLLGVAD